MRKSKDRLLKDQNTILSDPFLEVCRDGKTNTLLPVENLQNFGKMCPKILPPVRCT